MVADLAAGRTHTMSDDEWETDGDFVGGDAFNQKDQAHHSSTSAVKGASGGVGAGLNLSQMEEELRQVEHDKEKAYSEQRRQNLYGGDRCATDQTNASLDKVIEDSFLGVQLAKEVPCGVGLGNVSAALVIVLHSLSVLILRLGVGIAGGAISVIIVVLVGVGSARNVGTDFVRICSLPHQLVRGKRPKAEIRTRVG